MYVGILMPKEIGRELALLQDLLIPLPVRLIPPKDMHLTLLPPWEEDDHAGAMQKFNDALYGVPAFTLTLQKLAYGPTSVNPRLVWALAAHSEEVLDLKKRLLYEFNMREEERVPYVPHVTVARFRRPNDTANVRVPLDIPLNFSVPIEEIQLLESPHKGGVGYREIAHAHLSRDGVPK